MLRPALLWSALVLGLILGCDETPDRTPTSEPIEYGDPVSDSDSGPLSMSPETQRIEMH